MKKSIIAMYTVGAIILFIAAVATLLARVTPDRMTDLQRSQIIDTVAFADNGLSRADGECMADVWGEHFTAQEIAGDTADFEAPEVVKDLENKCGIIYN